MTVAAANRLYLQACEGGDGGIGRGCEQLEILGVAP